MRVTVPPDHKCDHFGVTTEFAIHDSDGKVSALFADVTEYYFLNGIIDIEEL